MTTTPTSVRESDPKPHKWTAFGAIGVSLVTTVMSMSMVFVSLPAIADDFGITLKAVGWVVITNSLVISSLMLPMGRAADIIGRRKMHLAGMALFGLGCALVALAPTFGLVIAGRVVMATGSAMGQSVGTAMIVAVFPAHERGTAIGSQTTAVAIGAASGPVLGGAILEVLSWEALFALLLIPVAIALIAGYVILDENLVSPAGPVQRKPYDWAGAGLSAMAVVLVVLIINNPLSLPWTSPVTIGAIVVAVGAIGAFVTRELSFAHPMLQLGYFRNRLIRFSAGARVVGFMGSTVSIFLTPVFLISLRSMDALTAGAIMFLNSVGLGVSAQTAGRLSDRFGPLPFIVGGFTLMGVSAIFLSFMTEFTPLGLVALAVTANGIAMGLWNVPNNSSIMGSVGSEHHGVVGALTNLLRNLGNVVGQAVAVTVVATVMATRGFEIPLDQLAEVVGADQAFVAGWALAFRMVAVFSIAGVVLTFLSHHKIARPSKTMGSDRQAQAAALRSNTMRP